MSATIRINLRVFNIFPPIIKVKKSGIAVEFIQKPPKFIFILNFSDGSFLFLRCKVPNSKTSKKQFGVTY